MLTHSFFLYLQHLPKTILIMLMQKINPSGITKALHKYTVWEYILRGQGRTRLCFHCHILTHATLYRKAPRCVLNTFIHSKHNLSSLFVSLLGEGWIYSLPIYLMLMKEWIKSNHINHIKGLLCNVRNGTHHERMHTPTKTDFHTIS